MDELVIDAADLYVGDIIESHDDKAHEVVRVEFNDYKRMVKVTVWRNHNENDAYVADLPFDAEIHLAY